VSDEFSKEVFMPKVVIAAPPAGVGDPEIAQKLVDLTFRASPKGGDGSCYVSSDAVAQKAGIRVAGPTLQLRVGEWHLAEGLPGPIIRR